MGVIYILTNPSFEAYVKIGYADDIERRLKELNRSECIPFAFRVYATYEVSSRLSDLKVHELIDTLNPNLRSIDTFGGQKRIREFYAMSAEDAYSILKAIAAINGLTDKLKRYSMTESERQDEENAEDIAEQHMSRAANFTFSMCGIQIGEEIEYYNDSTIKCKVVSERKVLYQGKEYSLSALAKKLSGRKSSIAGPRYFKYHGMWLNAIRREHEFDENE